MCFSLFPFPSQYVQQNVYADQQKDGSAQDQIHGAHFHFGVKEIDVAVHSVPDGIYRLFRNALCPHLRKDSPEKVVAQKAGAVGAGQERKRLLQPLREIGDGHIRSADKAVACADNGAYRRNLPLAGEEKVDDAGQDRAEQTQEQNIQQ